MPVPELYSDLGIVLDIDPESIWNAARTLIDAGEVIADRVDGIHKAWSDLNAMKMGWVGKTSDEADAFNHEWNSALKLMFGTKENPESGVLNQVTVSVMMAANNYALTEDTVTKMFSEITAALNAAADPNASSDRNDTVGPIHEVTPQA